MIKMVQEPGRVDPFIQHSPDPRASATPGGTVQAPPVIQENGFMALTAVLNNPWVQKYLHIIANADVQRDALAIFDSPRRNTFFLWEIGWIVFMLVFKVWRMMKAKGFWAILYTQLWTLAVFLAGVFYFVPRFALGPEYLQFVHSLMHAV